MSQDNSRTVDNDDEYLKIELSNLINPEFEFMISMIRSNRNALEQIKNSNAFGIIADTASFEQLKLQFEETKYSFEKLLESYILKNKSVGRVDYMRIYSEYIWSNDLSEYPENFQKIAKIDLDDFLIGKIRSELDELTMRSSFSVQNKNNPSGDLRNISNYGDIDAKVNRVKELSLILASISVKEFTRYIEEYKHFLFPLFGLQGKLKDKGYLEIFDDTKYVNVLERLGIEFERDSEGRIVGISLES